MVFTRSGLAPQVLYGVNQRVRSEDVDSPLCAVRPVKTVLLVVLTGDRGLCGGYNNFIIKKVGPSRPIAGLQGRRPAPGRRLQPMISMAA
jgi:F0F1-type ATP synthase gamma subunit